MARRRAGTPLQRHTPNDLEAATSDETDLAAVVQDLIAVVGDLRADVGNLKAEMAKLTGNEH